MTITLDDCLTAHEATGPIGAAVSATIRQLAAAALEVRDVVAAGLLQGEVGAIRSMHADGDVQKELDVITDEIFFRALAKAPVAAVASEERHEPVMLDPAAPLAVAIDPLDGSSNIETNVTIGSIFSILPMIADGEGGAAVSLLQPGRNQLAAGFFLYGPQFALVLTLGAGTQIFVYSVRQAAFVQARAGVQVPPRANEYAINASNYRHWDDPVRRYVDDCVAGAEGPHGQDYNMRWVAAMVADAYRILLRGGVYIYPGDARKGYAKGRLRLIYEASPIAMVIEQAGGRATDCTESILDIVPTSLHQRVPLAFGSAAEVTRLADYHAESTPSAERMPLFGTRGLFRS